MSKNPKNSANIDIEFFHIFWMTWGNPMKLTGKMCFKIVFKIENHKKPGFYPSLEDIFFEKSQGGTHFGVKKLKHSRY